MRLIDIVGLVLAVLSTGLAVWSIFMARRSIRDGKELERETRENLDMSKSIADALSTRSIDRFPKYLPNVAQLIAESKRFLWVLAIVPSHGSFTAPEAWGEIQLAIHKKRVEYDSSKDAFQSVLVYGGETCRRETYRLAHSDLQGNSEKWETWKQDHHAALQHFLRGRSTESVLATLLLDEYIAMRLQEDEAAVQHVYKDMGGFTCCVGNEMYPFYCWITDAGAIFSIKTEDEQGNYLGSAVYTRDAALVKALRGTFEACLRRSVGGREVQLQEV